MCNARREMKIANMPLHAVVVMCRKKSESRTKREYIGILGMVCHNDNNISQHHHHSSCMRVFVGSFFLLLFFFSLLVIFSVSVGPACAAAPAMQLKPPHHPFPCHCSSPPPPSSSFRNAITHMFGWPHVFRAANVKCEWSNRFYTTARHGGCKGKRCWNGWGRQGTGGEGQMGGSYSHHNEG